MFASAEINESKISKFVTNTDCMGVKFDHNKHQSYDLVTGWMWSLNPKTSVNILSNMYVFLQSLLIFF